MLNHVNPDPDKYIGIELSWGNPNNGGRFYLTRDEIRAVLNMPLEVLEVVEYKPEVFYYKELSDKIVDKYTRNKNDDLFISPEAMAELREWQTKAMTEIIKEVCKEEPPKKINFREFL